MSRHDHSGLKGQLQPGDVLSSDGEVVRSPEHLGNITRTNRTGPSRPASTTAPLIAGRSDGRRINGLAHRRPRLKRVPARRDVTKAEFPVRADTRDVQVQPGYGL